MIKKLSDEEILHVKGGEHLRNLEILDVDSDFNRFDILFTNLKDVQEQTSKKRFQILRAEADNYFGKEGFFEFINHELRRVYYVKAKDSEDFVSLFNEKML